MRSFMILRRQVAGSLRRGDDDVGASPSVCYMCGGGQRCYRGRCRRRCCCCRRPSPMACAYRRVHAIRYVSLVVSLYIRACFALFASARATLASLPLVREIADRTRKEAAWGRGPERGGKKKEQGGKVVCVRTQSKQGLADRSRIGRRIQPEATFSLTAGRGALSGRATGALALPCVCFLSAPHTHTRKRSAGPAGPSLSLCVRACVQQHGSVCRCRWL